MPWRDREDWRWDPARHRTPSPACVSVIEPAEPRRVPASAHRVPFGFGPREPAPEQAPEAPLRRWEADDRYGPLEVAGPGDP